MRKFLLSAHGILSQICLGLGGMLLILLGLPERAYPVPVLSRDAEEPILLEFAGFEAPDPALSESILGRLVFSPERERVTFPADPIPEPEATPPPPPPPEPPDVALVGIIADGEQQIAMIRRPSEPLAVALRPGGTIEGWEVTRIAASSITLQLQSTTHEVRLVSVPNDGR